MAAELLSGSSFPRSHVPVNGFTCVKGDILSSPPQGNRRMRLAVRPSYRQAEAPRVWQQDVDFAFVGERKDVLVPPEELIDVTTLRSFTGGRETIFHGKN